VTLKTEVMAAILALHQKKNKSHLNHIIVFHNIAVFVTGGCKVDGNDE